MQTSAESRVVSTSAGDETSHAPRARWLWLLPLAVLGWLLLTGSGRSARRAFLASLRVARPQATRVTIPAFSGPAGTRRLEDAVAAMVADSVHSTGAPTETRASDAPAASRLAGFPVALPAARHDTPALTVEGARTVSMVVDRGQLATMLRQAGRPRTPLPAALDGARLSIATPAGVRALYGHCPASDSTSLQNQLAGPPPPVADQGDCVVLVERPAVTAQMPAGLDMPMLTGVALEIAGMSPTQARAFQRLVDWRAALALTMPRFLRSYELVQVRGTSAMLLNLGGRRGPTYDLVWAADGRVYALLGYGSAADAVPLAASLR